MFHIHKVYCWMIRYSDVIWILGLSTWYSDNCFSGWPSFWKTIIWIPGTLVWNSDEYRLWSVRYSDHYCNTFLDMLELLCVEGWLNKLETLLLVLSYSGLEQDRICSVLRIEQWIVSIDLNEEVEALVTLVKVRVILGERDRTSGTPASRKIRFNVYHLGDLNDRLVRYLGHEDVSKGWVLAKMKHELRQNLCEQMQDFSTAIKLKDPLLNLI